MSSIIRGKELMVTTTTLTVALVALAYAFSANAYYVETQPSQIAGETVIVIRRGHPLLNLPGLDQVLVQTGMNRDWIASEHRQTVNDENLWGFSRQTALGDDYKYYKWGQDVAESLKLEHRAPMLWYLGQEEEAFQAILAATSSQETELLRTSVQLLGQVVEVKPQRGEQALEVLLPLLKHKEPHVRLSAASALMQVEEADPQLAEQALQASLPLLEDKDGDVRRSAASALGQVVEASSAVAEQVIRQLLLLLEEEHLDVRQSAASALGQVAEKANSQLVEQVITELLRLLEDEQWHVRASAVFALGQVAEKANPAVAEQVLQALLSTEEFSISAMFALGQVGKANPQLAEQIIRELLPRLKDENEYARDSAASALGQVAEKANPAVAEQVFTALLPLLEDKNSNVRQSAASALGQVAKANPAVVEQVFTALLPRLKDENSNVRQSAASALGQVAEANPAVAEQVITELLPRLQDKDSGVRDSAVSAVGRVYAYEKDDAFLFDKLTAPQNALERPVAACALFLIALQDPIRGQGIHSRLEELAKSREPIERIWANKTLAMLDLATEAHEATELDNEQQEQVANKLFNFGLLDFFGQDFTWAVWEARNWLEEQGEKGE